MCFSIVYLSVSPSSICLFHHRLFVSVFLNVVFNPISRDRYDNHALSTRTINRIILTLTQSSSDKGVTNNDTPLISYEEFIGNQYNCMYP